MDLCKASDSAFAAYLIVIVAVLLRDSTGQTTYSDAASATIAGPERFYQSLKCHGMFRYLDSAKPYQYRCNSIENRDSTRCYFNGVVYDLGQFVLRSVNGTQQKCRCALGQNTVRAAFRCRRACPLRPLRPGYYMQRNMTDSCPGPEFEARRQDRYKCIVGNTTYLDGNYFRPVEPDTECYCGPGYEGINRPPYCQLISENPCKIELARSTSIAGGCLPVFEDFQSPELECPLSVGCPLGTHRTVVGRFSRTRLADVSCQLGNLSMIYGDIADLRHNNETGACIRCYCSVGPLPTCVRLPLASCDPLSVEHTESIAHGRVSGYIFIACILCIHTFLGFYYSLL